MRRTIFLQDEDNGELDEDDDDQDEEGDEDDEEGSDDDDEDEDDRYVPCMYLVWSASVCLRTLRSPFAYSELWNSLAYDLSSLLVLLLSDSEGDDDEDDDEDDE